MPSKTSRPSSDAGPQTSLGVLQGRAAGHDREASEESAVGIVEEVVTPLDGASQGALPLGQVARAAREQRESIAQSVPEGLHGQDPQSCGGKLDGQGQAVELRDDVRHRRRIGVRQREVGPRRHGSLDEEADRLRGGHVRDRVRSDPRQGQRGHLELVLAVDAQGDAAGRQHGQLGAVREQA